MQILCRAFSFHQHKLLFVIPFQFALESVMYPFTYPLKLELSILIATHL